MIIGFCLYISKVKNISILFFFVVAGELLGQSKTPTNHNKQTKYAVSEIKSVDLKVISTSKESKTSISQFKLY